LALLMAAILLLVPSGGIRAASYKWTDREGTLHFSDSIPAADIPTEGLDPADPEQRPLLGKPLTVYRDKVFTIALMVESDDLLQFDLTYTDVQRTFPEVVGGTPRIQISAIPVERIYTYLAYSVAPVEGGSKTVPLMNRMSKQSPQSLETEALRLFFYEPGRDRQKLLELFSVDIPFVKRWQKRKGVTYQ